MIKPKQWLGPFSQIFAAVSLTSVLSPGRGGNTWPRSKSPCDGCENAIGSRSNRGESQSIPMGSKMAEREGFEPSVGLATHAFQACALNHSAISPPKSSRNVPTVRRRCNANLLRLTLPSPLSSGSLPEACSARPRATQGSLRARRMEVALNVPEPVEPRNSQTISTFSMPCTVNV